MKDNASNTPLDAQLTALSDLVNAIRRQLTVQRARAAEEGITFPSGINKNLNELSDRLDHLAGAAVDFDLERRNLEALVDVGQIINSSLDTTTVLNMVMDTIIRLTGAQRAFLMMRDDEGDMDILAARNWERESLKPGEYEFSTTIVKQVLSSGQAILTTNASADPRFGSQESIIAYNLRSVLCVPLKVRGKMTGVIYADNRVRESLFTEQERSLLTAFANQAAVALENATLFASIQQTLNEVIELKTLMEDIFASIGSGVITADVNDEITLCNQAIVSILGKSKQELVGSLLRDTLSSLAPDLPAKIDQVKEEDQRYMGLPVQTSLGERGLVDLSLNITPLKTGDDSTRGVTIVVDDLTEKKSLEAQQRLFERMVSPAVIDQLDPDELHLGGRRRELTTLFADLRAFTALSEATDPETLVNVLNAYLAAIAESVLNEEGTIDKFLGDAVMAWFNAPVPQPDHTLRAVRAALAMKGAVEKLHEGMAPEFRLSLSVGIHCGEALLGLIGTHRRIDYTAIGDSVNTAKRLQENAAPGQILISHSAGKRVQDHFNLNPIIPIQVEGKEAPLMAFEVLGPS